MYMEKLIIRYMYVEEFCTTYAPPSFSHIILVFEFVGVVNTKLTIWHGHLT